MLVAKSQNVMWQLVYQAPLNSTDQSRQLPRPESAPMRKSWGTTWRAVGVSPPSRTHLTRRADDAPLAGFAATGDVTPLTMNPAIMPFKLCMGAYSNVCFDTKEFSRNKILFRVGGITTQQLSQRAMLPEVNVSGSSQRESKAQSISESVPISPPAMLPPSN